MTFAEAAVVLGVKLDGLDENALRLAFSRAVKLTHPDTTGVGRDPARDISRAKAARDALLRYLGKTGVAPTAAVCHRCKGTGTVPGRLGRSVCPECKGRA